MSGLTTRRRLDPLDTSLLEALEEEERRLYRLVDRAMARRSALREALRLLRFGADPGVIRASLEASRPLLVELRRVAKDLN